MITPHLFKTGERVMVRGPMTTPNAPRGTYEVVRLLPPDSGGNLYRLKSETEVHERVVPESQIVRINQR